MRQGTLNVMATVVLALAAATSQASPAPLDVVNLRMKHYNDHRVDAMLDLYSEDIEVYTYPDRLLGKGKEHLRKTLESILSDKTVRVSISHQLTKDSYVVNEEAVTYAGSTTKYVSIYEVRDGLIRTVRFVRD